MIFFFLPEIKEMRPVPIPHSSINIAYSVSLVLTCGVMTSQVKKRAWRD